MITKKNQATPDIIVVGGGAAGMMAAGRAAERGAKVILVEKTHRLGNKLLLTMEPRKFTTARWQISTPLGFPVEPEV